jgi:hypothetical protein
VTAYTTPDGRQYRRPADNAIHCPRCHTLNVTPFLDPWSGHHGDLYVCEDGCEEGGAAPDGAPYVFDPSMCECDECWTLSPLAGQPSWQESPIDSPYSLPLLDEPLHDQQSQRPPCDLNQPNPED